ncbi:hypothetical protein NQ017_11035, partial [Corynebacterium sp. 732RC1]|uniref:hypothetical protein n=1 Tax=unclassified Corynebacterium TaxID=2624378 RepID=UPI00211C18C8
MITFFQAHKLGSWMTVYDTVVCGFVVWSGGVLDCVAWFAAVRACVCVCCGGLVVLCENCIVDASIFILYS